MCVPDSCGINWFVLQRKCIQNLLLHWHLPHFPSHFATLPFLASFTVEPPFPLCHSPSLASFRVEPPSPLCHSALPPLPCIIQGGATHPNVPLTPPWHSGWSLPPYRATRPSLISLRVSLPPHSATSSSYLSHPPLPTVLLTPPWHHSGWSFPPHFVTYPSPL